MTLLPDGSHHGVGFRVQPVEDWSVLREAHPNVLVSGPPDATDAFVLAVTPYLHLPIRRSACDALLTLPDADGTLILRNVDALDREQQERLLRWLDETQNGDTQVISITATALYARVQAGTFLDRLYYRLNVIHFEVTPD